ncbi:MAG: TetR/AcrR family transcriptional regulator [Deltaproteobacteria bacterium]|jgi:AcrR family transcriptional regulator|nr:TetR/AcrR family transcriptional regulator [Deltaproteobacteria bacterium]
MSTEEKAAPSGRSTSREVILRTAAACFAKDGYSHTRMVAVARAAGISRAGLYKQFPSKVELLLALHEFLIEDWRAWLEEAVAGAESARAGIECWLREGLADSWRVTAAQVLLSEDAQADLATGQGATREAASATRPVLVRVLERGVASGELRADLDPGETANSLQAILLGLLRSQAVEHPVVRIERRAEIDSIVDLIARGIIRS